MENIFSKYAAQNVVANGNRVIERGVATYRLAPKRHRSYHIRDPFQTAVFSCHSSRAGSIDPGYHDVDDYDDDGNRRYDEGRFGVREDYAGDGYWSPAPTASAEKDPDLERNRYALVKTKSVKEGPRCPHPNFLECVKSSLGANQQNV